MQFREVGSFKCNITSNIDFRSTYDKIGIVTRELAKDSSKFVHRLQIYDFKKLEKQSTVDIYQTYSEDTHFIKFVSDRNIVAIATKFEVRFYQIQPLKLMKTFLHQQSNIYDLSVSFDGELVVLVGLQIKAWRTNGFRPAIFPHVISSARFCAFSNDNKYMAISSNSQINIYTFSRQTGDYLFFPEKSSQPPPVNEDITSIQFNPTNSNQLIVGFLNVSPQYFTIDDGYFKTANDIQPLASKNTKKAVYMPDGKRFLSYDYLNGIGLWPGVGNRLFYKQQFLLYSLRPNAVGSQFIGRVWQKVKVINIEVQCKPQQFSTQCPCPSTDYSWDYASYSCQPLSCLQSQHATGQKKNNQCVCSSGYVFNKALRKCMINCSSISRAVAIGPNTGFCYCKDNYVWNDQLKQCEFNCKVIPYSAGILIDQEKCSCKPGFVWSAQFRECVCPKYSKVVGATCLCYDQYIEDDSGKCIIDCTQILKTTGNTPNQQQCQCQKGYFFAQYAGQVGCKLNCTNFPDTQLLSPGFVNCTCIEHMNWVDNKCKIDCGVVGYSSGQSTTQLNQCKCAVNYLWIDEIHQCGKNCTMYSFIDSTKKSTLRSCPCIKTFNWNQQKSICQIDCSLVNNTNPYSLSNPSQCQCRGAFNWVKNQFICQVDCAKIWDAKERVDDYSCTCNSDKVFNATTFTCNAATSQSFFSSIWTILGFAVSIVIFIMIMFVLIRYCWQFKTKHNKEHDKKLKTNDQAQKPRKRKVKKQKQKESNTLLSDERLRTKTTM